jgi:hypothetical protein
MGKPFKVLFDTSKLPSKAKVEYIFKTAMVRTQNTVMQKVFDESQQLVPVDTGALQASGTLELANEYFLEATIEYGADNDPLVDYAVVVHEDLQFQHAAPTQAKYLEVPYARHQEELRTELIKNLKEEWERAGLSSSFSAGTFSEDLKAFGL